MFGAELGLRAVPSLLGVKNLSAIASNADQHMWKLKKME
jgi:hypothetical protein